MRNTSFHNFLMLRRPLLSIDELHEFNEIIRKHPDQFNSQIIKVYKSKKLQNAIFLSSSELYHSLMKIMNGDKDSNLDAVCKSLYKYLIRMCTRCTPFGTFAGFATGEISDDPTLFISLNAELQPKVKLSFDVLNELCETLSLRAHIFPNLTFLVNSSLYRKQDGYYYIKREGKNRDIFSQAHVQENFYLQLILNELHDQFKYTTLYELLINNEMLQEQAKEFILELYDNQILISDLVPDLMQRDHINILLEKLNHYPSVTSEIGDLQEIKSILLTDNLITEQAKSVGEILKSYIEDIRPNPLMVNSLIQPVECKVNQSVLTTLQNELNELMRLSQIEENSALSEFCEAFTTKYGQNQIPFLQALDPQTGIGYGNMSLADADSDLLLDRLTFPTPEISSSSKQQGLDTLRLDLYQKALKKNLLSIQISPHDLYTLPEKESIQSEGFYLLGSFAANTNDHFDRGEFKFIHTAMGGPSAFNLISRFCIDDPLLSGQVIQSISQEELLNPDRLFAEINHLPDLTSANILSRANIRKYQITYLATSFIADENNIKLTDLLISVRDRHRIVLYSKSHQKEICPRLTSAHNFTSGIPVYRFLCDVAQQDASGMINWSWGNLKSSIFLPRIEYKHFILSLAQWNINKQMLHSDSDSNLFDAWEKLCIQLQIPRFVQLIQADQKLLIDNKNPISSHLLIQKIQNYGTVRIEELIGDPSNVAEGKVFHNEIIIPFLNKVNRKYPVISTGAKTSEKRCFQSGEKWLYLKIYAPVSNCDQLLTDLIFPFCTELENSQLIDKWFFLRYNDPDTHLRLRLHHGKGADTSCDLLKYFCQRAQHFLDLELIFKYVVDSYERELERYTGVSYALTEKLFHITSQTVVKILFKFDNENFIQKWHVAIMGVDWLLNGIGLNCFEKKALIETMCKSLFNEYGHSMELIHDLNKKYRENRKMIETIFETPNFQTALTDIGRIFVTQTERYNLVWNKLKRHQLDEQYISSMIHMFLNKLFSSNHRKLELVIYYFIKKYYHSICAKELFKNEPRKKTHNSLTINP